MPLVDLVDDTFVVADPSVVARSIADPEQWRQWWPDLSLTVFMDRGEEGLRWTVTGELVGSAEIWLERWGDGVILHFYLRADPTRPGSNTEPVTGDDRRLAPTSERLRHRYARSWKRHVFRLKDQLEADRSPGTGRE